MCRLLFRNITKDGQYQFVLNGKFPGKERIQVYPVIIIQMKHDGISPFHILWKQMKVKMAGKLARKEFHRSEIAQFGILGTSLMIASCGRSCYVSGINLQLRKITIRDIVISIFKLGIHTFLYSIQTPTT